MLKTSMVNPQDLRARIYVPVGKENSGLYIQEGDKQAGKEKKYTDRVEIGWSRAGWRVTGG
jgi:hypothetical protein